MSTRVIKMCDKCKKEVGHSEQFWTIGVRGACTLPASYRMHYENADYFEDMKMDVCRPCLESFGIHVMKKADVEPPQKPTLESVILEIVKNAIGEQQ